MLTGAFLVASVSLCPGEPARIAAVLVVVTVATWAGSLTFAIKYLQTMGTVVEGGRSQGKSLGYLISFALTTQFATVPSLVGALLGVAEVPGAVYWIGGGVLAAFTVAIFNTWVLLVEIRR